jgi:hypothetical protein
MQYPPPMTPGAAAILQARQRRQLAPGQQKVMVGNPGPPPVVTTGNPAPIQSPGVGARPRPALRQKL